MSTNTARKTVASAHARMDAVEVKVDRILALLEANAPAKPAKKTTRKPARKAPAKKAAVVKAPTKGERAYGAQQGLTKKDFNRTVTTKARLAGGDTYKRVLADWALVTEARDAGLTPDQVVAQYTA